MRLSPQQEAVQQHCRDADANRAVREVEGRPMRGSEVKIQKVDNSTEAQPVDDVAHGTADDQPDRDGQERSRSAAQPVDQDRNDRCLRSG